MRSLPMLAAFGDQGSGKTTITKLVLDHLAAGGVGSDRVFTPKFADPFYEVCWWLTGEKHREFLQDIADALRGGIGPDAIVSMLEGRVAAAAAGKPILFALPETALTAREMALWCLGWFGRTDALACARDIVDVITRHFGKDPVMRPVAAPRGPGGFRDVPSSVGAILSDDARTVPEWQALNSAGFMMVRVDAEYEVRMARCMTSGIWRPDHSTEGRLGKMPAHVIVDNSCDSLDALRAAVSPVLSALREGVWKPL